MGQLLFKKCFWQAVLDGAKTATVRRRSSPRVKVGKRACSPGIGCLRIESVEVIQRLASLSDADARADGFTSAAEMRRVLRATYPSTRVTRAPRRNRAPRANRATGPRAAAAAGSPSCSPRGQSSGATRWFKITFRVAD